MNVNDLRIVFFGKGTRGVRCLEALHGAGYAIARVVTHPDRPEAPSEVRLTAEGLGLPVVAPDDPNASEVVSEIMADKPDVVVLGGYGKILRSDLIGIARIACVNLHAGRLPAYRGSSPLNWALIRGETGFGLSIIEVDAGVDTGRLLAERTFPIGIDDTIADLHGVANRAFPEMLLEVLEGIARDGVCPIEKEGAEEVYWPMRFPDDGGVLFDLYTAEQIHNRIRALTSPYPGAFTSYAGRRVALLRSELPRRITRGEPGRVYRVARQGLLVAASDRCLWIREAEFEDGTPLRDVVARYDRLATVREAALRVLGAG